MIKKIILIISSIYILVSCGTTHCPEFPKELEGYLPYLLTQNIKFQNDEGDTISCNIDSVYVTPSSDFKNNCPCECWTQKNIFTISDSLFNIKINPILDVYGEQNDRLTFNFNINSNCGYFEKDSITYSKSKSPLGDTIIFDKYQGEDFSKITVVYNKGLVSFYDNRYNCTWKLVE